MKALECAHRLDYKQDELGEDEAKKEFHDKPMKILFSSPLSGKAKVWYDNFKVGEKQLAHVDKAFQDILSADSTRYTRQIIRFKDEASRI